MHKFVRGLVTEWRRLKLPFSGETVIVGVSGGADSVSLLLALADLLRRKKISHRLVAAHFDHGLRGAESRADADFVRELAAALGIEFVLGRGKIAQKGNLEQNARRARYDFLLSSAKRFNAFAVLTAHTVNDQAETFLMNLIRGSGPDGLSAMPAVRRFKGAEVMLVRPLLGWATRGQTEEFCRENGTAYRNDSMNEDLSFTRVRIRRELIPLLQAYNPKIIETLARTSGLLGSESEIDPDTPHSASSVPQETLAIDELKAMPKAHLYATLRAWIRQFRGDTRKVGSRHIEAIERLINSRKSGKTVELPGSFEVQKRAGRLMLSEIKVEK